MLSILLLVLCAAAAAALPPNHVYGLASVSDPSTAAYYSCLFALLRWDTVANNVTVVGTLPTTGTWLAANPLDGQLYSCAEKGYLCTIDATTAAVTKLCPALVFLPSTAQAFHPTTGLLYSAVSSATLPLSIVAINVTACTATTLGNTTRVIAGPIGANMVGNTFYFFNGATTELLSVDMTDPTLTIHNVVAVQPPLNVGAQFGGTSLFNLCTAGGSYVGMQLFITTAIILNQTGGLSLCDGSISTTTAFTATTNGLPGGGIFADNGAGGSLPGAYYFLWRLTSACFPTTLPTCPSTTTGPSTSTSTSAPTTPATQPPNLYYDVRAPRVGVYFQSAVSASLTGVHFYSPSGTQAVTVEAFNASKALIASITLPSGTGISAGYANVLFISPPAIAAATTYYVSVSMATRLQSLSYYNGGSQVVGNTTYINGWYQYPPFTNPVSPASYGNSGYYVFALTA